MARCALLQRLGLLIVVATGLPAISFSTTGCDKLSGKSKAAAAASASAAALAASLQTASAYAAMASAKASAAAAAASASAAAAANASANEKAKGLLADLQWMVAKKVTVNPAKAGEGDASSKCDSVESMTKSLAAHPTANPDPELKKTLEEAAALCAFDVPLVIAIEALDHLRTSTSQASKRLMCDVALKECDRARVVKPTDKKLRQVDARRRGDCGR